MTETASGLDDELATLTMSTKGQVCIPTGLRSGLGWTSGSKLHAERVGNTLVIRSISAHPQAELGAAFGILPYSGPAKSIVEMNNAVRDRLSAFNARDRY